VAAMQFIEAWQRRGTQVEPEALVFATWSGRPISPNNVLKHIVAAAKALGLPKISWLTFRRTYSSWAHEEGVPGKVADTLMRRAEQAQHRRMVVRPERLSHDVAAVAGLRRECGEEIVEMAAKPERRPVAALADPRDDGVERAHGGFPRPEPGVEIAADEQRR